MLAVVVCLCAINVPVYAQGNTVPKLDAEAEITNETVTEKIFTDETISGIDAEPRTDKSVNTDETTDGTNDNVWDQVTTESIFEDENYRVTFTLSSYWDAGYNANIRIHNLGDEVIENWYLKFDFANEISNIWNAEVSENLDKGYVIKNAAWNQDIAVGEYVEFGFSGNEDFSGFPKNYQIIGSMVDESSENYTLDYRVDSKWENGFTANVVLSNKTQTAIEDWVLEFDFDNEIANIWNAVVVSHEGNHYVIKNAGYNQNIDTNGNISFGFVVNNGNAENEISNALLYKYGQKTETPIRDREPLDSIGEAYVKEPGTEDIVTNEETGIVYVKNQILVSAYLGVDRAIIEEIALEIGAEIVGYIELTNDYQLEFTEDKTAEELDMMIEFINSFSFISNASLNIATERFSEITTTNDTLYNDSMVCGKTRGDIDGDGIIDTTTLYIPNTDNWDEGCPDGDNWGLEALKVSTVWDNKADFQAVRIGVYDNMFSPHNDVLFDDIRNNPTTITNGHGMHVAGIMAALHDNGKGISGIATDARLYAYSCSGNGYGSSMGDKLAYATLIGNHVKVINVSLGMAQHIQYAASHGNQKAIDYIEASADILSEYLNKLVIAGYDFLIVTSAGNTETSLFMADESSTYGFRDFDSAIDNRSSAVSGNVLAYYDCELTAIDEPVVKSRIIVVGSMGHRVSNGAVSYNYSTFSNVGNRVDVCAPGEDILSTVPANVTTEGSGYQLMDGTSMASPHIAGLAALMYQANPSIKATTVKRHILSSGSTTVTDVHGNSYVMPDATVCYTRTKNTFSYGNGDIDFPSGILAGYVKDRDGKAVPGVQITAIRKSTGEYNLDNYSFDAVTDADGYYLVTLPQGTYDMVIYARGYLPYSVKNVEILPDETKYMETLILSTWYSLTYNGIEVSGLVIDALDGTPVVDATVKLRKGWNNTTGAYAKNLFGFERTGQTNALGTFAISAYMGAYTAEISKNGYVTGYYNIVTSDSGYFPTLVPTTMVLTPILSEDEYRIVLTWGGYTMGFGFSSDILRGK